MITIFFVYKNLLIATLCCYKLLFVFYNKTLFNQNHHVPFSHVLTVTGLRGNLHLIHFVINFKCVVLVGVTNKNIFEQFDLLTGVLKAHEYLSTSSLKSNTSVKRL